jgi:cytochrome d ubiquinol oxidase subunit I
MDIVLLSRIQFATTTIYHFLFVPLTIGLSFFLAAFETAGLVKKSARYSNLAAFFGRLFLINFAVGAVTGIVQEFEFGMNWSQYSRYVGDVFGAPLAVEALAAFFLESTFIGIWLFGKGRVSDRVRVISIWLVAIATCLSAYWIIVANSFMQNPTGYEIVGDHAVMTNFWALISNESAILQFMHTVAAAIVTGAFFVIGVSAIQLLRKKHTEMFTVSFKAGTAVGMVALLVVAMAGDMQGKYVVQTQPMKMAAAEALWDSEESAGFNIVAGIDEAGHQNTFQITVPGLLSFLGYGNFTQEVQGINQLQQQFEQQYGAGNYTPPVALCFWSFRLMLGMAGVMLLLCVLNFWKWKNERFQNSRWLLTLAVICIPAPFISNSFGWVLAEVGREPWMVYGLLTVDQGVSSNLTSGMVLFSIIGFLLIYTVLAVAEVKLMAKYIKKDALEG